MSLLGQLKPVAIKLKITQCDKLHIFTPRCSNTFQIWTFLWNYLYISHLNEIYPMSLLGQLKPVAIKLKITQCDKLHIFTPRCSNTFQIWTFLWNYLYISHLKEIYPMSLLGQLKPVAIKLKITQYDRWPIFSPRWYKTLRIRTFYRKYHYNSHLIEDLLDNTEALTQTTVVQIETEFEHFFEIISILAISKKYIRIRCSHNLNQLRSSWKLLNAINYTYSLRVVQIHFKFEHFFEIIYISHLKEIYPMSLLGQLKPVAIKLKITQCDKLHIFTPRCSNTFQIWTFLWNYLYISHLKEIYPMSLLGQLKPVAIKLKITQCDRWHIFSPRWTKHFEFGHFISNITITVISLKIYLIIRKL